MHKKYWSENLKGIRRRRWKDNIKVDLKERGLRVWTRYTQLRILTNAAGACEHGNELSVSIKGGQFIYQLSDYLFLKKDSAPMG
jgi:hypothetical protein